MIDRIEILNAVGQVLKSAYPSYPVYFDLCPEGSTKPCFCLKHKSTVREDVNRGTVSEKLELILAVAEAVDSYTDKDGLALLEIQQAVMDLFRSGTLQVGDRWLRLEAEAAGRELNIANVVLRLGYFDLRETPAIEEDKIQTVEMRVKKEE